MNALKLIKDLEELVEKHGDLPIVVNDDGRFVDPGSIDFYSAEQAKRIREPYPNGFFFL